MQNVSTVFHCICTVASTPSQDASLACSNKFTWLYFEKSKVENYAPSVLNSDTDLVGLAIRRQL
ncbi:hypothetical protein OUZ56_029372 [Daphnia magna]|uniref:Uncharacterized protein n=1 Tax=Daphnia magna TaxID=35525 RepID=A0ABR0B6M9_9CRUS|nr:hypothetical protein OUZ56_029372 [Daphnia magna]